MATIEVLKTVRPELRWTPLVGDHTVAFIKKKKVAIGDPSSLDNVLFEAQTILGRCVPPTEPNGDDTGLVVGYVQSGKTLSFTTVMALARDNGYQLIILIAGIGLILKSQSEQRLFDDLGIRSAERAWAHFENPSPGRDDAKNIGNILSQWKRATVPPHKRRTILITVLKQHTRLCSLVSVLAKLNLQGVPTLIVDDEADQASLNNQAARNRATGANRRSTTYDWITQLKQVVPHHTLIQYTATPQANLLLSLQDVLSPSFAEQVTPGPGYVGGKDFFARGSRLVTTIPASDLPSPNNQLRRAPPSLLSALRYFLLGAAEHYLSNEGGNRSMMVHPSQSTGPHGDYKRWLDQAMKPWVSMLALPEGDSANQACRKLFEAEYKCLSDTTPGLRPFNDLMAVMPEVMADARIMQVNSTVQGERDVKWHDNAYWILVGGQKLDRGFTVEGLTVTYMPRALGGGNADTLQQRARFFGYKSKYKGLCRVFLEGDTRQALQEYVESEEFVRDSLRKHQGKPLAEWKRDFILTRMLNPTRRGVIGLDTSRVLLDHGWLVPGRLHVSASAVAHNRQVFSDVISKWQRNHETVDAASEPKFRDLRGLDSSRNWLLSDVPLSQVLNDFLIQLRAPDSDDGNKIRGVSLALIQYLEKKPFQLCDVILIGGMASQTRSITSTQRINQVFMGKTPNVDQFDKLHYVGDAALHWPNRAMLHLRKFDLREDRSKAPFVLDVPWFTLYLPQDYVRDSVIELPS